MIVETKKKKEKTIPGFTMLYVWEDLDAPEAEQKFGDHFSEEKTLRAARIETKKYIRKTLGRQKHKFDQGRIKIHHIWNATEYAKLHNRFGKHKKVDDLVRKVIGHHVQADVHAIDADTLITRVNKELIKHNQPLPVAGLSQNQYMAAENVLESFDNNKKIVLAELTARFGKTIWAGVMVRETDIKLTVIASYVLTSFVSFEKDLTSFEQFRDFELVESGTLNWKEKVDNKLAEGKQVIVFLSMCPGPNRQDKIDFIFGKEIPKLLVIDEADFGVHQIKQSKPLIGATSDVDKVILMTGTNGDRAASIWEVDHYLSVMYTELLAEKHQDRL